MIVSYVVYLLLLWAFFLDRIYQEEMQLKTNLVTTPKVIFGIVLYLTLLIYCLTYAF